MTDVTQIRAELRAGLDGVPPDSWRAFAGIVSVARNVSPNAIHIARCSPENIRALLEALDDAERERDEARDVAAWVETWVCNPASAYSVSALDGLFAMTRDRIEKLKDRTP